jgi:hypothetical protein
MPQAEADRIARELAEGWSLAASGRTPVDESCKAGMEQMDEALVDAVRLAGGDPSNARDVERLAKALDRDVLEMAFMMAVADLARHGSG